MEFQYKGCVMGDQSGKGEVALISQRNSSQVVHACLSDMPDLVGIGDDPAVLAERAEQLELGDLGIESVVGPQQRELVRRLMLMLVPDRKHCGGQRRFTAGYRRMVALVWVLFPELLDNASAERVAMELGMSRAKFYESVEFVKDVIGR